MDETLTLIEQSIQKKSSLTERIQKMIKKCDDAIIYKGDKIKSEHFSPTNS